MNGNPGRERRLFVTHAFLIKAWQVEAGAAWGRGFLPLILKTKHKTDLRGKRDLKCCGSGIVGSRCKGLSESCLKHLRFRFPDENEAAVAAGRGMMMGCLLLAFLQGLQNTNTPAPHSALGFFVFVF